MIKKITALTLSMIFSCMLVETAFAGQPGTTGTIFNRRFIQKVKPMMPYDQLVKIAGAEGAKVGEEKRSPAPKVAYHWDGGRKSVLDVNVVAGKVVDATVTSPKNKKFSLEKSGN